MDCRKPIPRIASLPDQLSPPSSIAQHTGAENVQNEKDGRLSQHADSDDLELTDNLDSIEHRDLSRQSLITLPIDWQMMREGMGPQMYSPASSK
jgi:hypothetical protein